MHPYIAKINSEVLAIGGSIAKSSELFLPRLEQLFDKNNFSFKFQIIDNTEAAIIIGASYALVGV